MIESVIVIGILILVWMLVTKKSPNVHPEYGVFPSKEDSEEMYWTIFLTILIPVLILAIKLLRGNYD